MRFLEIGGNTDTLSTFTPMSKWGKEGLLSPHILQYGYGIRIKLTDFLGIKAMCSANSKKHYRYSFWQFCNNDMFLYI